MPLFMDSHAIDDGVRAFEVYAARLLAHPDRRQRRDGCE
jgi:hypothetical protein